MPLEVLSWPEVDLVVVGEGEKAMLQLAEWVKSRGSYQQLRSIPNLYYKNENEYRFSYTADYLSSEELDTLPLPAYHLLDFKSITSQPQFLETRNAMSTHYNQVTFFFFCLGYNFFINLTRPD